MSATRILERRPLRRNSLLGFAKVELSSGLVISDVTILTGERGPWASPASKPMIDRDGVSMKDQRGKIRYSPFIEFASEGNPGPLVRGGDRSDECDASGGVRR